MVKLWVIGETTQVISRVQGMKSRTTFYFSDLFDEEDFEVLWSMHRLILQLTFCVFLIEDFPRSLLTFLRKQKISKFPEMTSLEVFSDKQVTFKFDLSWSEI